MTPTPTVQAAHAETGDRREPLRASCSGCTTRWSASSSAAHCSACHETFKSTSAFDDHRVGFRCRAVDEIQARGYERNGNGMWRRPMNPTGDEDDDDSPLGVGETETGYIRIPGVVGPGISFGWS